MATIHNNNDKQLESSSEQRSLIADNSSRSMSIDVGSFDSRLDRSSSRRDNNIRVENPGDSVQSPKENSTYGSPAVYRQRYPQPNKYLRSVVTTSFSMDDERDDVRRGYSHRPSNFPYEQRMDRSGRHRGHDEHEREGWGPSTQVVYFTPETPSPKSSRVPSRHYLNRTYSSSGYFVPPETMKRSYYHHSMSLNPYQPPLPPEFMPPMKRSRMEPIRKEIYVSPEDDVEQPHMDQPNVQRTKSFPTRSMPSHAHIPMSPNAFSYHARYVPTPNNKYTQISPGSDIDESPRSWSGEMVWTPSPYSGGHFWESPRHGPNHGPLSSPKASPTSHTAAMSRSVTRDQHKPPPVHRSSSGDEKMRMMVEAAAKANTELHESTSSKESFQKYKLLALPDDRMSLSETLCVVRENIEVFTATQADVDAPAPGRKHAVLVGQVGLRCIHCRHTIRNSDRVKRAVCYPSSIKRIYRTVIDMKLDHFTQCKFVPASLKNHLNELKAVHTRSTGTTMLYFIKAAKQLGMLDASSGVILSEGSEINPSTPPKAAIAPEVRDKVPKTPKEKETSTTNSKSKTVVVTRCDSLSSGSWTSGDITQPRMDSMASWSFESPSGTNAATGGTTNNPFTSPKASGTDLNFEGIIPLALPEDKSSLSPLRCFLREQVCAFSATENDIAVRAPTTFSITVGQVGIGCIHCVQHSARHRSNRAVCFPFSIGRIYQSVADIQRFHFGECRCMPEEIRTKFLSLQSASSKGSKGLATRQYWMSSARKIGLIDTPTGIRFGRDPTKPESAASFSLDILAQVAFTVTTASKPLVLPEDKPCIAEFLYIVMEQLQPCRFTEADRNKRRLKDVGCIGVECKHCAGQVDSRKFFWSSVSAVESNFVSVHTHVLECKYVPAPLKERLVHLKSLRKEQTAALRTGSQKSFFARVWQRLHENDSMMDTDPTLPSSQFREIQKSASSSSTSSSSTMASLSFRSSAISNKPSSPPPPPSPSSKTTTLTLSATPVSSTALVTPNKKPLVQTIITLPILSSHSSSEEDESQLPTSPKQQQQQDQRKQSNGIDQSSSIEDMVINSTTITKAIDSTTINSNTIIPAKE